MGRGKLRRLQRLGRTGAAKGLFGPIGDLLRPGARLPTGRAIPRPRATPFPRSDLHGVSIRSLRDRKPRGWREVPTRHNEGFIWVDENGVERLRFMRPTGTNPASNQWSRQSTGYIRWQSAQSGPDGEELFLDIDGNIVPRNAPNFAELTHIPYEGLWP